MKTCYILIASFILLSLVCCKKVENRSCIKSVGAEKIKVIDLPFFNNKFAFDSFNLNRIYHLKLKYEQKK